MSGGCDAFRSALTEAVLGPGPRSGALASDPHVAVCAPCRAALAREAALERLLACAVWDEAPAQLAERVRAGLAPERARRFAPDAAEGELDALLAGVPAPAAPLGLAGRVLGALAVERARRPPRGRRNRVRVLAFAAAALVALGAFAWLARPEPAALDGLALPSRAAELAALEADAELLLYAAERWELLHDADLDLWLASLDADDQLLVEYADEVLWTDASAGGAR